MICRNEFVRSMIGISAIALASSGSAASAQAQDGREQAGKRHSEDADSLPNDIVVTAFKRDETVQDVPVSLSVITGRQLNEYGIRGFSDYLDRVPGLTSDSRSTGEGSGQRAIGLRGIQSLNGTFSVGQNTVGFYIDDVPVPIFNPRLVDLERVEFSVGQNTVGFYIDDVPVPIFNPRLVDLERVEVLRGPQGTLYGASSLNGTIKLITRAPDPKRIEGTVFAGTSITNWGGQGAEAEASINIPLSSTLAVRASGYYQRTAGYIDTTEINTLGTPTGKILKDANKVDAYGLRLSAGWKPSPDVDVRANVMYTKSDAPTGDLFTARSPGGVVPRWVV